MLSRSSTRSVLFIGWASAMVIVWAAACHGTLPSPGEVLGALRSLWWEGGLGPELFTSVGLIALATLIAVVVSFGLAWAAHLRALEPATALFSKLRFLGLTGLVFPFTLLTGGGFSLKVALLAFGMATFLTTALARIVAEVPTGDADYVRSLGASPARVFWEAYVRGPLDRSLDAVRQNIAMAWSMITMVEGIARSDGGVGALLLSENKHFKLAEVFAVLVVILLVGLLIDGAMGAAAVRLCPHTKGGSR